MNYRIIAPFTIDRYVGEVGPEGNKRKFHSLGVLTPKCCLACNATGIEHYSLEEDLIDHLSVPHHHPDDCCASPSEPMRTGVRICTNCFGAGFTEKSNKVWHGITCYKSDAKSVAEARQRFLAMVGPLLEFEDHMAFLTSELPTP